MSVAKTTSRYLLAVFMIAAGMMHFVQPDFYVKIMPPYLPWHLALVYLSGLVESACGGLLLTRRFSRAAAWGVIVVLIAIFPANVHIYQHQELIPASPAVHLLRLPLQAVFLVWAFWHTRASDDAPNSET